MTKEILYLLPLILIFGTFMAVMFFLSRKSLDIKSKIVGDGQHGSASFATQKEIRAAYQLVDYKPAEWRQGNTANLPQGIIVGCVQKRKAMQAIVDTGDVHALMIGAAGVGKTAKFLYPNIEYCCASGMSFVANDTKGDLLRSYAPIAEKYYGYEVLVLDLRNPTQSDGFNMLHMVNRYMDDYLLTDSLVSKAKAEKYAKIISKTVMNSGGFDSASAGQNAYFYDSAEGLMTAVILVLAEVCSPYFLHKKQEKKKGEALKAREQRLEKLRESCTANRDNSSIPQDGSENSADTGSVPQNSSEDQVSVEIALWNENLAEVKKQLDDRTQPSEQRHIVSVFKLIQDLLEPTQSGTSRFKLLMAQLPDSHKARMLSGSALNTGDQAMASVMSTALSRLNAFLDSELEQMLCFETKLDTEKFCKRKSALFLVVPEEDNTKHFLVSLIVQQLYREMLTIADELGGKLANRVVFLMDEFGTIPKIESAEMMFSASRSRRISFVPIIQSLAQLEKNYGKEGAAIVVDNCQLTIYGGFAPNSDAAEVLSKILGEQTVQTGSVSIGRDKSKSLQMTGRPLMSPDELKIMPKDTFIVTRTGVKPMKTKLKLFFEWGIVLDESYQMPKARVREVAYVNRREVEDLIRKKYGSPMPRMRVESKAEQQKDLTESDQGQSKADTEKTNTEKPDMADFKEKIKRTKV